MNKYVGYIAVYGWCCITAFSMLLTSEVSQRLSPFSVCFFTFSFATTVFLIYNMANLSKLWGALKKNTCFIDTDSKPKVKNQKFEGDPVVQLDSSLVSAHKINHEDLIDVLILVKIIDDSVVTTVISDDNYSNMTAITSSFSHFHFFPLNLDPRCT